MWWVRDRTGRFRWRPYYHASELDDLCERRIQRFLRQRHGVVAYPLSTDDLTILIEQEVSDLDLYADLAGRHAAVEVDGITTFFRHQRPRVQIARQLSEQRQREPRLRTTLAHELGHVLLHDFAQHDEGDAPLVEEPDVELPAVCTPTVMTPGRVDWMEWQAGYASGALLMPRQAVTSVVGPLGDDAEGTNVDSRRGVGPVIDRLQGCFLVSEAAAYVRLRQLGYLSPEGAR